jgi:DnaB-like helicase C terminal domain
MNQEKLQLSLQQDLLTLLCHDDVHGRTISKIVSENLFEGDYRNISSKALGFWKQYGVAPKQHIADLLADILEDKMDRRRQTYQRILVQMVEVKDQINADFVMATMYQFMRGQRTKEVLLEVSEIIESRGINGQDDVEVKLRDFLRERAVSMDAGMRLDSIDRVLKYFDTVHSEFKTGIKELDQNNIVPMRGKMLLLLAPAKRGKTWWLIQLGKMAFLQRKKVLHISLEIDAEEVIQRYYQALFGASKRDDLNKVSSFKFDKNGNIDQIVSSTELVPFTFDSLAIREELQTRLEHFGTRASNFIVKRFPMRKLTIQQYEAYLESLETVEGFVPDMVLLDYPKIMKTDPKNLRTSIGTIMEDIRGISQERNHALAVVHQGNRGSNDAEMVKATHTSEDWSIAGTVDFMVTYSQTKAEKRLGLARLFVELGRSEIDGFGVLITQAYRTGQFCLESTKLGDDYARIMESMKTDYEDDHETSDDGD